MAAEGLAQRGGLDGVAGGGAGAVELDVAYGAGPDAGAAVGGREHVGLGLGGGRRQGGAARVVVGRAAANQAQDAVAVGECGVEAFQDDGTAALSGYVAVGALVESETAAAGGQRAEASGEQHTLGQQVEVDPADQGGVGLARAQAGAREVERHQGGGLRGVDGDARSVGAEEGGQPAGEDAALHAGQCVLGGERSDVRGEEVGVVVARDADERAEPGPAHPVRCDPGVLQRLPAQFKGEPLLGVDERGLARGDPEERGVERVDALQVATRSGGVFGGGSRPAAGRQLADAAAT
ncbi:hypothetical protein EES44_18290 [Streptomyces sp. ADI96-15]|nr:hypothetical protein EES44_18290 [Streptomyces sp. ADI96-15]